MNENLQLRIEFIAPEQAAVNIDIAAPPSRQQYGELLLFACLALRQIDNMGSQHPVSRSLASALASVQNPSSPLTILLGPPQLSLSRLSAAMTQGALDPMDNYVSTDVVRLAAFKSQKGKRRFLASLEFDNRRVLFLLHPKGFNIMGEGVNYYAPLSVALLLRYLAAKHITDAQHSARLAWVSRASGNAALSGVLTSLNQGSLALAIAEEATEGKHNTSKDA